MKTEDLPEPQDPVWDLLTHHSQPRVPQDFVTQVLAEVRQTAQESVALPNVVAFPAPRRHGLLWVSLAAAAAVALGLFLQFRPADSTQIVREDPAAEIPQLASTSTNDEGSLEQELTAVQDVHALLAVEDPKQLNDAQLFAFLN